MPTHRRGSSNICERVETKVRQNDKATMRGYQFNRNWRGWSISCDIRKYSLGRANGTIRKSNVRNTITLFVLARQSLRNNCYSMPCA